MGYEGWRSTGGRGLTFTTWSFLQRRTRDPMLNSRKNRIQFASHTRYIPDAVKLASLKNVLTYKERQLCAWERNNGRAVFPFVMSYVLDVFLVPSSCGMALRLSVRLIYMSRLSPSATFSYLWPSLFAFICEKEQPGPIQGANIS